MLRQRHRRRLPHDDQWLLARAVHEAVPERVQDARPHEQEAEAQVDQDRTRELAVVEHDGSGLKERATYSSLVQGKLTAKGVVKESR